MSTYRITYQVVRGQSRAVEHRVVRRPWFGRSTTTPAGAAAPTEMVVTNTEGRWTWLAGAQPRWVRSQPGLQPAVDDVRPVPGLREAVREGLAEVDDDGRVLGRPCSRVRIGGPVGSPLRAPTEAERVELCVDRTGVILEQRWFLSRKLVEHRVATSFGPDATVSDDEFRVPAEGPADPAAGLAFPVEVTATDTGPPVIPPRLRPPPGFELAGDILLVRTSAIAGSLRSRVRTYVRPRDGMVLTADMTAGSELEPSDRRVKLSSGKFAFLHLIVGRSVLWVPQENDGAALRLSCADPEALRKTAASL